MSNFKLGTIETSHGHLTAMEGFALPADSLMTHGVILGQTGSGKTGMGIALLEEAALAGVPCIAVDPKGDLSNLLLQFPDCKPSDFEPWADNYVEAADSWRAGLGADRARIKELLQTTDLRVYTPGSAKGRPISLVGDLVPPDARGTDSEDLQRAIHAEVGALLEISKVKCDRSTGPEAILLASIIECRWVSGESITMEELIEDVKKPPFKRVGALTVDDVCCKRKRRALAQSLNSLSSAPAMRPWSQGEELDIDTLLQDTEDGNRRPRISILSIAHLDDGQRMFFLTKLLNKLVTWMRHQPGTGRLRALLYIDEVFGYLPPVKAPPSKGPLLLLLKQARAFGLGVVLASQNPIDVDYRALSNLGTWILGRLQTERDINRVADGLKAAAAEQGDDLSLDDLRSTMAGLPKRAFLIRSPDRPGFSIVKSRHTLSFLRGPMTLEEIGRLCRQPDQVLEDVQWQPPPSLEEVIGKLNRLTDEVIAETKNPAPPTAQELMARAAAGPVEALAMCRTVPVEELAKGRGQVARLMENIRHANQLIDQGRYQEAHAVWDDNPVLEPSLVVRPEERIIQTETKHKIFTTDGHSKDTAVQVQEKETRPEKVDIWKRLEWVVLGAILAWAAPIILIISLR